MSKHPFEILSYVNMADPHLPGRQRILGVRVDPSDNTLHEGIDYIHKVFDHYTQSKTFGCALAMRVLQSDLYHQLDDTERAECDELIQRWNEHLKEIK